MKILVIYHAKCPDGIGAAWCFYNFSKKLGWPKNEINYYGASYYQDPPDLTGYTDVYITDFSYSASITLNMKKLIPGKLVVLDHHESAITNLASLKPTKTLDIVLDKSRSGAQIAWDYLAGSLANQRPWFINYIGDRDLWLWKLSNSKEINRALAIEYFSLDNPIEMLSELSSKSPKDFIKPGEYYLKMETYLVKDICNKAVKIPFLVGTKTYSPEGSAKAYTIYLIEANVLISEVGDYLIQNPPDGKADFIVIWRYSAVHKTFNYSARCAKDGPDLAVIAKTFGGGGHKQAAGFSTEKFLF